MGAKLSRRLDRGAIALVFFCACARPPAPSPSARADQLRREGNLTEAYAALADGLCGDPSSIELARELVQTWDELGRPGSPTVPLRQCAVAPVVTSYVEGLVAAATGDTTAADRHFADALARAVDEQRPELTYRWGLVALRAGASEVALERLREAAGLAPDRCAIRLAIASAKLELGDYAAVVDELRGMLRISPTAEQLERGREILKASVRRSESSLPDEVNAKLAVTLAALDRSELSRDEMLAALELANEYNHPRVLTVAGIAALRFGVEREASRLLVLASELNPLDPDPPRALGISLYAAQRLSQALAPLREAHHRDPLDPEVALRLGKVASSLGDRETARASFHALTVLKPNVSDNYLRLARIERQLGDLIAAKVAVEAAYRLDRKNIPLLLERAAIHAQLAHTAASEQERQAAARMTRSTVEELLEVSPRHPGADALIESLEW